MHSVPAKNAATEAEDDAGEAESLRYYLEPLSALLQGGVTEVCVNRPLEAFTEGPDGWTRHEVPELDFERIKTLVRTIANYNKLPNRQAYLSGRLPDRERVQVVQPPCCTDGTFSLTIRKPSMVDMSLEELEQQGSFEDAAVASEGLAAVDRELMQLRDQKRIREFLDLAVRSHKNILLAGATGSGKTTVMKSLIGCIPRNERVITIEDAHEIFMLGFPNKVHLFYRNVPDQSAQDALKSCMRMKPDRILLAELRGHEAWDYMDSLNTGHPGSLSSIHANSALDAFPRLASLLKQNPAGQTLSPEYLQQMCFETIDVVLFYKHRRLKEVYFDPMRRLSASRLRTQVAS
ncbi:P-type DNA transfer ATPase VirB11 [Xanthomonas campestris]|uniref:P-type DNA transfer ATPase VirB11 n=1 Tax=Xanthomonas campestris TaxID=339 RepID=UPI00355772D1